MILVVVSGHNICPVAAVSLCPSSVRCRSWLAGLWTCCASWWRRWSWNMNVSLVWGSQRAVPKQFLRHMIWGSITISIQIFNDGIKQNIQIQSLMFVFLHFEQMVFFTKSKRVFVDTDKLYFLLHLHEFPTRQPFSVWILRRANVILGQGHACV